MLGVLFTQPTSTDFLASIGNYSSPFFDELLPIATFAIGVTLGALLIAFLIRVVAKAVGKVAGVKDED